MRDFMRVPFWVKSHVGLWPLTLRRELPTTLKLLKVVKQWLAGRGMVKAYRLREKTV
jgi:hypothetical protein